MTEAWQRAYTADCLEIYKETDRPEEGTAYCEWIDEQRQQPELIREFIADMVEKEGAIARASERLKTQWKGWMDKKVVDLNIEWTSMENPYC